MEKTTSPKKLNFSSFDLSFQSKYQMVFTKRVKIILGIYNNEDALFGRFICFIEICLFFNLIKESINCCSLCKKHLYSELILVLNHMWLRMILRE